MKTKSFLTGPSLPQSHSPQYDLLETGCRSWRRLCRPAAARCSPRCRLSGSGCRRTHRPWGKETLSVTGVCPGREAGAQQQRGLNITAPAAPGWAKATASGSAQSSRKANVMSPHPPGCSCHFNECRCSTCDRSGICEGPRDRSTGQLGTGQRQPNKHRGQGRYKPGSCHFEDAMPDGVQHTQVQHLVLGFISLKEKRSEPAHGEADVSSPDFSPQWINLRNVTTYCRWLTRTLRRGVTPTPGSTRAAPLTCPAPRCTGGV